jgi:ketosteroid isomerase-like protein
VGTILDKIKVFYDGWDSGDSEAFTASVAEAFVPGASVGRPEEPTRTVEELMPLWLVELEAWKPQSHEITTVIEGGDAVMYEYIWRATHNSVLETTDGRVFPPTGRQVQNRAGIYATWNGEKLTSFTPVFSNYQDIVRQIEAAQREAEAAGERRPEGEAHARA